MYVADYALTVVPIIVMWISWSAGAMTDFSENVGGLCFFIILLFHFQLIGFSYVCTSVFTSPKSAIAFMPMFIVMLILAPMILLNLIYVIFSTGLKVWTPTTNFFAGVLLYGIMLTSPHGALFVALLDITVDLHSYLPMFPPIGACIACMLVEGCLFLYVAYYTDMLASVPLQRQEDSNFNPEVLVGLDNDVEEERSRTLGARDAGAAPPPLRVDRLRKVFPPKRSGAKPVVACQDVAFTVSPGEIFGLLGANGAGKTTTLSMLTRHLVPTSGDAFVVGKSILSEFASCAKHVGVVTQHKSLWELLSVEDHLYLFARLRGVPEDVVTNVVNGTIDQLELTPHRHKLAGAVRGCAM